MTDAQRDAFLAQRRYGILTTLRASGAPISLPVWYEWDGATLRMFCHVASAKVKRLKRDARANVLVVNHPNEMENWVAFDGRITARDEGGLELAERVFDRTTRPVTNAAPPSDRGAIWLTNGGCWNLRPIPSASTKSNR